jgi:hypothetical protein
MSEPAMDCRRWWRLPDGPRASRLADAFLQDYLMAPRIADREREREANGWNFHYAVGADVVMLYADPAGHARAGRERAIGYGEIFRTDSPDEKTAIALVLARFLWYTLGPEKFDLHGESFGSATPTVFPPLLLLPPVDDQLGRIVRALHDELVGSAVHAEALPSIRAISNALASSGEKPTEEDLELLRKAGLLAGPAAALSRIRELLAGGRLRGANAPETAAEQPALARALAPPRGADEVQSMRLLTEMWAPALLEARSKREDVQESRSIAVRKAGEVAEAMARLELVNRRLAESGERLRLLYITGDTSVFTVGARHNLGDLLHQHCPDQLERPSFADAFLRHPRAFLDEPEALRARRRSPNDATLDDILTMELGQFRAPAERFAGSETSHFLVAKASRVRISVDAQARIQDLEKNDPEGMQHAIEHWRQLTRQAMAMLPPPSFFAELDRLARGHETLSLRQKFSERRDQIDADLREAVNELFETVVFARMLLQFPGDPPPRDPPYFVLEKQDSPVTQFVFDAEQRWRQGKPFRSEDYRAFRTKIQEQPGAPYFLNLANGWLLAAQGHWKSASRLAEIAVAEAPWHSMSEPDPDARSNSLEPIGPNGREARYLLATCLRHLARSESDLGRCEILLTEAEDIAKVEARTARERQVGARLRGEDADDDTWTPDIVPERFASERRALELAGAHFRWDNARHEKADDRLRAQERLLQIAETIEKDDVAALAHDLTARPVDEAARIRRRGGSTPPDMPPLARRQAVRRHLFGRALRHCIGIELLVGDGPALDSVEPWLRVWPNGQQPSPVLVWRRDWRQSQAPGAAPPSNGLTELQDLCGIALHALAEAKRRKAQEDLRQLRDVLATSQMRQGDAVVFDLQRLIVHPYDRERFRNWISNVIITANRRRRS